MKLNFYNSDQVRCRLISINMKYDNTDHPTNIYTWSHPEDIKNFGGVILVVNDDHMPMNKDDGTQLINTLGKEFIDSYTYTVTTPGVYDQKVALFTYDADHCLVGDSSKCVIPQFRCIKTK